MRSPCWLLYQQERVRLTLTLPTPPDFLFIRTQNRAFPKKLNAKQNETKKHESWVAKWPSHPPAAEKVGDLVMAEQIYVN